ncbi:MAG: inositol monophosphatase family protein [Oliverpabstia sp.]
MEKAIHTVIVYQSEVEMIIRHAGKMMKTNSPSIDSVHSKEGIANYVTDYDVQIQEYLIRELNHLFPDCSFFGEEDTNGNDHSTKSGFCFFIDPIDGTTNYIFGYHHSCVSVGVSYDGEMIAGFVYNPYVEEFYSAIRGHGSFLNRQRLYSKDNTLENGIVAFGCARYNEGDTDALFQITKELYLNSLSIRNGGSAALDLCRIASGSNVAYVELKLQPYDYAAASVIIEEAGGVIGQVDGSAITLNEPCSVLAGTLKAVEQVRQVCRKYLGK